MVFFIKYKQYTSSSLFAMTRRSITIPRRIDNSFRLIRVDQDVHSIQGVAFPGRYNPLRAAKFVPSNVK